MNEGSTADETTLVLDNGQAFIRSMTDVVGLKLPSLFRANRNTKETKQLLSYMTMDALDKSSGVISPFTCTPNKSPVLYRADLLLEKAVREGLSSMISRMQS